MESVFRTGENGRGAYLSRLFAFFSEEIVRHWADCEAAPYRDLGRPVVWGDDGKYHVLDFTFQRRSDGARFIAEMKCEVEFDGYKYLILTGPDQVAHHQGSAAFTKFLRLAREPKAHPVTIGGKPADIDGSILVWGVVSSDGRQAAKDHYGVADVLGVEDLLKDLGRWQPSRWADWVATRRRWTDDLFGWLAYPS